MRPNPIRTLPSTAVHINVSACTNMEREHNMVSIKMGDDSSVGYVEICNRCNWIDEKSLQWWVEDAIKNNISKRAQRIAVAAESQPFQFVQGVDEPLTLEEILFQSLGAASMCWESPDKAGVFDSSRAKVIGESLMREVNAGLIKAQMEGPHAELAYEMYALLCNSQHDGHGTDDAPEQWAAAFERLKARFHELLPNLEEKPAPEAVG